MKRKYLSLLLAVVMLVTCMTACGGAGTEDSSTEQTAGSGEKILRVATQDPQVPLDMQLNTYSNIMKVTDNITESLLTTNSDGSLEPTLLTGMPTLSDDKLTYSFELKDGVKFHNGAVLTSNDVKYSLERLVKKLKMASLMDKGRAPTHFSMAKPMK